MLSSSSLAAPTAASSELHPAEVSGLAKLFGQSAQGVYMNSSSLQCLGSWLHRRIQSVWQHHHESLLCNPILANPCNAFRMIAMYLDECLSWACSAAICDRASSGQRALTCTKAACGLHDFRFTCSPHCRVRFSSTAKSSL